VRSSALLTACALQEAVATIEAQFDAVKRQLDARKEALLAEVLRCPALSRRV
jgi:hypothetical protein